MDFIHSCDVSFQLYCPRCTEFCYKFYQKEKCKKCMKIVRRLDTMVPLLFEEKKEVKEKMTDYDYIIKQIEEATINMPDDLRLSTKQFQAWMDGYMHCYDYILGIINCIKEANS